MQLPNCGIIANGRSSGGTQQLSRVDPQAHVQLTVRRNVMACSFDHAGPP